MAAERQVNRGLPFIHRFTASAVNTVTVRGPDDAKTQTTPTLSQDGSSKRYTCAITPDELGLWSFTCEDGSGNITHEAHFECVLATDRELALGIANPHKDLVEIYPHKIITLPVTTNTSSMPVVDGLVWTWLNYGKVHIPYDGTIYGVKLYTIEGATGITSFTSLKFFTASGTGTSFAVRSMSEDIHNHTPEESASGWAWRTYRFNKPVLARKGDMFGVIADATATGADVTAIRYVTLNTDSRTAHSIYSYNGSPSVGDTNTGAVTTSSGTLCAAPLMHPPVIALAGHSFWASHSTSDGSHTPYEDSTGLYVVDNDLAAMISDRLGVSVIPIADGGTNISHWVGEDGLLEVNAGQVRPAVLLYDSVYNDAANFTAAEYSAYLDRLLAHCDELGIELVMLESPSSDYAVTGNGSYEVLRKMNDKVRNWCAKTGIAYIPTRYRLNRAVDGSDIDARTRWYDGSDAGLDDYGEGGSNVHPSLAGRKALANAIARSFRERHAISKTVVSLSDRAEGQVRQEVERLFGVRNWPIYGGHELFAAEEDDNGYATWPCVLWDGSSWCCYYTGKTGGKNSIRRRTSADGRTNWSAGEDILQAGATGAWDDGGIWCPNVWKEGSTYFMIYAGRGADHTGLSAGLATSSDGITWTKEATNPVLAPSLAWEHDSLEPTGIIKVDSTYHLFYTTLSYASKYSVNPERVRKIGRAYSTDLINWMKAGDPVFGDSDSGYQRQPFHGYYSACPFKGRNHAASAYYLITAVYGANGDYSHFELWECPDIDFSPSTRHRVGVIQTASEYGFPDQEVDIACLATDDIARDTYTQAGEIRLYFGCKHNGKWRTALASVDDMLEALRWTPSIQNPILDALPQTRWSKAAEELFTQALTENYAAEGAAVTPAQALYEILQGIHEFVISGTAKTVKKRDGSTTAITKTLGDAQNPLSITRSS